MARASTRMSYTLMIWILERGKAGHQLWVRQLSDKTMVTRSIMMSIFTALATASVRLNMRRYFFGECSTKFG
jgi:hypothetical protein